MSQENITVNGFTGLADLTDFTLKHQTFWTLDDIKKSADFMNVSYMFRSHSTCLKVRTHWVTATANLFSVVSVHTGRGCLRRQQRQNAMESNRMPLPLPSQMGNQPIPWWCHCRWCPPVWTPSLNTTQPIHDGRINKMPLLLPSLSVDEPLEFMWISIPSVWAELYPWSDLVQFQGLPFSTHSPLNWCFPKMNLQMKWNKVIWWQEEHIVRQSQKNQPN